MKIRILLFLSVVLLSACAQKKIDVLSQEGVRIIDVSKSVVEVTDRYVSMKNSTNGNNSFAIMPAVNDWTPYKSLKWTIENKSQYPISLWVAAIESEDNVATSNNQVFDGVLLQKYYVEPNTKRTITFDFPETPPYREVMEDFRHMRNDPYSYLARCHSVDIDYSCVRKISFLAYRGYADAQWVISDVQLIEGKKYLPDAMNLTKDEFYPFIDKYGQFKHRDWLGKIHSDVDMEKTRVAEEEDLAANPGPKNFSRYGGWADGPRYESTGRFRVQKIDGKWWMIDPEGYLFWSHGVVRVTHSSAVTPLEGRDIENRCLYFEDLPGPESAFHKFYYTNDEMLIPHYKLRGIDSTYDYSSANLFRKYGEDYIDKFYDLCHKRLRSWGLNTIANSSDKAFCLLDRTPYVDRFEVISEPIAGTTGWLPVMDPYDPSFIASLEKQLVDRRRELLDPWCMGFFVDNEIKWGHATNMAEVVLTCPSTQAAKMHFINELKSTYRTIAALNKAWGTAFVSWKALLDNKEVILTNDLNREDYLRFNRALIHKYYANIRGSFDRLAPGVLYMGCRFAGYTPDLVAIGANYCDVISYNIYDFTLDKVQLPEGVDKPIMIGEFHFGAQDRGVFHSSIFEAENQDNRAKCYIRYVESALSHPNVIGVHWHQFSDQAATARFCGENFQVGFTDVCDTPYYETINAVRNVGYRMYELRFIE